MFVCFWTFGETKIKQEIICKQEKLDVTRRKRVLNSSTYGTRSFKESKGKMTLH